MTNDLERLARAKIRKANRITQAQEAAARERNAAIAEKKLERSIQKKRQFLFGRVIDDALSVMSHEQKALIRHLVHRAGLSENELALLPEFAIHAVAEPPSLKPAAAEFSRTGK
jgi:hypothetical protein